MIATYKKYTLKFKTTAKTSRDTLQTKETWFIVVKDNAGNTGIGECAMFRGLSCDDTPEYEGVLKYACKNIKNYRKTLRNYLTNYPSIKFGIETALNDLENGSKRKIFDSPFYSAEKPIPINGLIWMGSFDYMKSQVDQKIEAGYNCIKIKIGAIDFSKEVEIIEYLRKKSSECEIRLDANGAFTYEEAKEMIDKLKKFNIHSIEQPIKQKQYDKMSKLCAESPIKIALDEELIGLHVPNDRKKMLETIKPHYIILKPSLIGGFYDCDKWIKLAEQYKCGWWITSALESNIGLNAIAQYTSTLNNNMPQGLGTGQLYSNNIESPLEIDKTNLIYKNSQIWNVEEIVY